MARRKLNRNKKAAPAAPATPEPATPAAAAPVAAATTAVAPQMQVSPALASIFEGWALPSNVDLDDESGPGFSRVGFYSGRGASSAKVVADLGDIPKGTPFLYVDGKHHHLGPFRYMVLKVIAFYGAFDSSYNLLKSWDRDPGKAEAAKYGAKYGAKECYQVLGLVVPGKQPLGDLEPAVLTLDNWRGAASRGLKAHLKAIEIAGTPEWAKKGSNGALCSAPQALRVSSAISGTSQKNKDGTNEYIVSSAFPAPLEAAQVAAVGAWSTDADLQEELADYTSEFDRRAADIEEKKGA